VDTFHPPTWLRYGVEAFFTVGVIVLGKILLRWKRSREGDGTGDAVEIPRSDKEE